MFIYVVLLICSLFFLIRSGTFSDSFGYNSQTSLYRGFKRGQGTVFMMIFCVILISLRSKTVGIDTPSYIEEFNTVNWLEIKQYYNDLTITHTEIGYLLFMYCLKSLGLSSQFLFIMESIIIMIPLTLFVNKFSKNPAFSILLFICFDYFGFALTGTRQTIADGLILLSFLKISEKRILPSLLLFVAAVSFHTSSLIALPLLFLHKIPLNKITLLFAAGLAAVVYMYKENLIVIIQLINLKNASVGEQETGGMGYYYFLLSYLVLIIIIKIKEAFKKSDNDVLFWMIIISIIIYPALTFNPTMFRLHYYYSIASIIVLPNLIYSFTKNRIIRMAFSCFYLAIAIFYYFNYPLSVMGIVPYEIKALL